MNGKKHWARLLLGTALTAALLAGCPKAEPAPTPDLPVEETGTWESLLPMESQDLGETAAGTEGLYTDLPSEQEDATTAGESLIDADGTYSSLEDVALYLHTYGELPDNFITKNEARDLGWSGGGLESYAPGMCIGGDTFGNREGLLPKGSYHECDINTLGAESRGAERIVWDEAGNIYYTGDHYESFELIYAGD